MALVPQTVEVPFEGGVDTKTDRKKVIPGKLLALENAVFDGQEIRSRPGAAYLANGKVTGGSLTTANALAVVGGELLRWDDTGVYGYANASAAPWVQRGDAVDAAPLQYEVEAIAQRARSCETFDSATLGGVTVHIWTEAQEAGVLSARRILRASVIDAATGTRFQDATALASDTGGTQDWRILARVFACGGRIVILYGVGGSGSTTALNAVVLDPAAPEIFAAPSAIATMKVRAGDILPYEFDVAATGTDTFGVAYSDAGGITVARFIVLGATVTLTSPAPVLRVPVVTGAAEDYTGVHLWSNAAATRLYLAFKDTANLGGVYWAELHTLDAADHSEIQTAQLLDGTAPTPFKATILEAAGEFTGYIDSFGDAYPPLTVRWDADGAIIDTALTWQRMVHIAGEAFSLDGVDYIPCTYPSRFIAPDASGVQPTFMLLEAATGRVRMRALAGAAGGTTSSVTFLPSPIVSSGIAYVAASRRGRVEFDASSGVVEDVTPLALVRLAIDGASPAEMGRIEETRSLHAGGALPTLYDGSSWVEDGFHVQPEGVAASVGIGGSLSAGSYAWVVCFEWTDAQGRLHRSAPSIPVRATAAAGGNATITVYLLHLTRKRGVRIALYRTTANGTVFYRTQKSGSTYIQEDPGTAALAVGDVVMLQDGVADATIQDNEILPYGGAQGGSVGGELWHRPPPGYRYIHKHQSYLFAVPMDDPYTVRYTLPLTDGEGPAWADELVLQVPSAHGKAVALATVDDKLVILCERGAYVVYGQGPLRNGADNGLTEPMYVTGSVGCADAGSVCETPDGIMYAATSGLHLLSRGLETVKLGAPVDLYAAASGNPSFSRAIQMPATKELRWYMEGGRTLIYSSEWRQWGTWTNQPTKDAVLFNDVVHYADGSGVRYEAPGEHEEVGSPIIIAAETAWLKWAGMQGLQRVWKAYLLFSSEVSVNVTSSVYVDYDDTAPIQVLTKSFAGSLEGGRQTLRLRQTLKKQLCTALRFRWEFERESSMAIPGGTVALSSLTLEFGVQRAPSKRKVLKFQGG